MPNINEYLKKKSPKDNAKKSDWDISRSLPTSRLRRPGRSDVRDAAKTLLSVSVSVVPYPRSMSRKRQQENG